MFQPRKWQPAAIESLARFYAGRPSVGAMVVAGTGSGKTLLGLHLADAYLSRGERVLWVAAQQELLTQPLAAMQEHWSHRGGIVQAKRNEADAPIVFASKSTIAKPARLDAILSHGIPKLVVVDECHESTAPQYVATLDRLRALGPDFLGLTATPEDAAGQLSTFWQIVHTYSLLEAIEDGVIVQPYLQEAFVPGLDLGRVAVGRGDWLTPDLERELLRTHIVGHTVAALEGRRPAVSLPFGDDTLEFDPRDGGALVHCVTVNQAGATSDALNAAGWRSEVVWGEMKRADRARVMASYGREDVQVLCSAHALIQGVDLPYAMTNVNARPTRSRRMYVQMMGRVLRPYTGKRGGLLIDLVGASKLHSLIGAPVLLNIGGCPLDDGYHRYEETRDGGGVCPCGSRIRCFKAGGPHVFKKGRCTKCGADQCADSPSKDHVWMAWGEGKKRCIHCPLEIQDPMFTLIGGRYTPEPVAWVPLQGLPAPVDAVDLGRHGALFSISTHEGIRPLWVNKGTIHPLSPGPVSPELARLLTDDVARQASKVRGQYGGHKTPAFAWYTRTNLLFLAKKLKVWS